MVLDNYKQLCSHIAFGIAYGKTSSPVAPRLGSGVEAAPVAWSPETCVATVEAAQRILICADALIHSIHIQLHL